MQRAIAFSRRGKLVQAQNAVEKAQKIRPADAFFQDLKAELLMRNRQFSKATEAYEKLYLWRQRKPSYVRAKGAHY